MLGQFDCGEQLGLWAKHADWEGGVIEKQPYPELSTLLEAAGMNP
jgi:hypothetical protein